MSMYQNGESRLQQLMVQGFVFHGLDVNLSRDRSFSSFSLSENREQLELLYIDVNSYIERFAPGCLESKVNIVSSKPVFEPANTHHYACFDEIMPFTVFELGFDDVVLEGVLVHGQGVEDSFQQAHVYHTENTSCVQQYEGHEAARVLRKVKSALNIAHPSKNDFTTRAEKESRKGFASFAISRSLFGL